MKKKIQLPWAADDIKAEKTRELKLKKYWELSRSWHGLGESLTVTEAIQKANKIMEGLDPSSRIHCAANILQNNLVAFGSKRCQQKIAKDFPSAPIEPCRVIIT